LCRSGLEVITPTAADRAEVLRTIYDELCRGVIRDESRTRFQGVIDRLIEDGAEGVILACTEIELLIGPADSAVPVFPTTRLHARAAIDYALGPVLR
jgi:aspartate racemase